MCFGSCTFKWTFLSADVDVSFLSLGGGLPGTNKLLVDVASATGDLFSLKRWPRGNTAFVILLVISGVRRAAMSPGQSAPSPV